MILLKPQATNRFGIIPREYVTSAYMTLRDDSTNVVNEYTLVPRVDGVGNIVIINDTYLIYGTEYENLVEGHFYDLTLYADDNLEDVIYRDKAFCTAQKDLIDDDFYKINKDQYTTYNGNDNDYIVI
ncbi:hypothetical protein [uncultured Wocania sp.]|uniref:hypothetical protein n=1 Tax=uncultured Wocania sp. TaxID=2834404 RepID=UPI0030F8CC3F